MRMRHVDASSQECEHSACGAVHDRVRPLRDQAAALHVHTRRSVEYSFTERKACVASCETF